MTFGPLTMTTQGTHSMPVTPCLPHSTPHPPPPPSPLPPGLPRLHSGASCTSNHHRPDSVVGNGEGQTDLYRRCVCQSVSVQRGREWLITSYRGLTDGLPHLLPLAYALVHTPTHTRPHTPPVLYTGVLYNQFMSMNDYETLRNYAEVGTSPFCLSICAICWPVGVCAIYWPVGVCVPCAGLGVSVPCAGLGVCVCHVLACGCVCHVLACGCVCHMLACGCVCHVLACG